VGADEEERAVVDVGGDVVVALVHVGQWGRNAEDTGVLSGYTWMFISPFYTRKRRGVS